MNQKNVEHNLKLVAFIANKFNNTGVSTEDLISIGTIGLINAVNTFDPLKNIKLATYASRCIENEILMHLRHLKKEKLEISIAQPLYIDADGNELFLEDVLGTAEDVVSKRIEDEEEITQLTKAISRLSAREQQIIRLRYGFNNSDEKEKTQQEVADIMGISQSYISRVERRIIRQLRKEIVNYR